MELHCLAGMHQNRDVQLLLDVRCGQLKPLPEADLAAE